ncbi:MAG: hypothetical protein ACOY90_17335 [Candidatus Zhuqueibacterota bacterium]
MMFGDPSPADYPEIEKLEEKVTRLITVVQKLYSENKEIKKRNEDLLQQSQEQQTLINMLKEQCYKLQHIEDNTKIYQEREENIRNKIQQMLKKLENLQ